MQAEQPQRADRVEAPARAVDAVAQRAHFIRPEPENQPLVAFEQARSRRNVKLELEPVDRCLGGELEPQLGGVAFEQSHVRELDARLRE